MLRVLLDSVLIQDGDVGRADGPAQAVVTDFVLKLERVTEHYNAVVRLVLKKSLQRGVFPDALEIVLFVVYDERLV